MKRITYPLAALLLTVAVATAGPQPNVVIFLVDDMGVMDTSVSFLTTGENEPVVHPLNRFYRTPNMERLAAEGIRFSDFYAPTVCSPSRLSIMTGQNSARHGTTNWIHLHQNNRSEMGPPDWNWEGLNSEDVTLPRVLRSTGYKTIFIGKAHFGPAEHEGADPRNLGFDVNIAGSAIGHPGSYYGKDNYGEGTNRPVPDLDQYHGTDTFLSDALTLEAQSEMGKAVAQEQPFFLMLSHYAVHSPFQSDPRFADHYSDSSKSERAQAYATLIEGADKSLGDVMDHLERLGVADNTLIFFLGDNGSDAPLGNEDAIASSAPLRGKKGSRWEGGIRVPFIAAWAERNPENTWQQKLPIPAGEIRPEVGACFDLFPTIADLVDVPIPEGHPLDGRNLGRLLAGTEDPEWKNIFLSHFPHEHRNNYFTTFREGPWKVIYRYHPEAGREPEYALYNLATDPGESNDRSEADPEKLDDMVAAMLRHLEAKAALYPVDPNSEAVKPTIGSMR